MPLKRIAFGSSSVLPHLLTSAASEKDVLNTTCGPHVLVGAYPGFADGHVHALPTRLLASWKISLSMLQLADQVPCQECGIPNTRIRWLLFTESLASLHRYILQTYMPREAKSPSSSTDDLPVFLTIFRSFTSWTRFPQNVDEVTKSCWSLRPWADPKPALKLNNVVVQGRLGYRLATKVCY